MDYKKRKLAPEEARRHATRCFGKICSAPCNSSYVWDANRPGFAFGTCPVTDIPEQNIAYASNDPDVRTKEWWRHKMNNVLHIITGYSCNAPCMDGTGCVTQHVERSKAEGNEMDGDESVLGTPVAIREVEMAFSEWGYEQGLEEQFEKARQAPNGRKAVVVGSSVAGLTAGIRLLYEGWAVECISAEYLGLLVAIPDDHLPFEVAERPAKQFANMGGTFVQARVVGSDEADEPGTMSVQEARKRGDVLILAPGTAPRELPIPGIELDGVIQTIPFLRAEKLKRAGRDHEVFSLNGPRCLHYGAGDTANDGARTVEYLLGDVDDVSLAVRSELAEEQQRGWGVPTHPKAWINDSSALRKAFGFTVIEELKGEKGQLKAAVMRNRREDKTWVQEIDHLFLSTGGVVQGEPWTELGVRVDNGVLSVDENGRTHAEGVYACGDAVLQTHRVFPYVIETANKAVEGVLEDYPAAAKQAS